MHFSLRNSETQQCTAKEKLPDVRPVETYDTDKAKEVENIASVDCPVTLSIIQDDTIFESKEHVRQPCIFNTNHFCSQAASDSKEDSRGDDDGVSQSDLEALISGQHPKDESPSLDSVPQKALAGKWVCAQSSESKSNNFNKHITDKLEVLGKAYTHQGDKWRALGYSKAVNALKSYHKPVTSYQVV